MTANPGCQFDYNWNQLSSKMVVTSVTCFIDQILQCGKTHANQSEGGRVHFGSEVQCYTPSRREEMTAAEGYS